MTLQWSDHLWRLHKKAPAPDAGLEAGAKLSRVSPEVQPVEFSPGALGPSRVQQLGN